MSAAPPPARDPREIVGRLVKLNNLMLFLTVAAALASLAIVQTIQAIRIPDWLATLLVLGRIVLPIGAIFLSGYVAGRLIDVYLKRRPSDEVSPAGIAPTFRNAKIITMWIFAAGAILAAGSLVFGIRVRDVILLAMNAGLLFLSRPSLKAFAQFVATAETIRVDARRGEKAEVDGGRMEDVVQDSDRPVD